MKSKTVKTSLAIFVSCILAVPATAGDPVVKPVIVRGGMGDKIVGENRIALQFKIGSRSTASRQLFVATATLPPGSSAVKHLHEIDEEALFVLEGEIKVTVGQESLTALPGDLVFVPPQTWMTLANASDRPAVVLGILPRAELEECFRAVYQPPESTSTPEHSGHGKSLHDLCRMQLPAQTAEPKTLPN